MYGIRNEPTVGQKAFGCRQDVANGECRMRRLAAVGLGRASYHRIGFYPATEKWRGQSADSAVVVHEVAAQNRREGAQSKGLTTNRVSGKGRIALWDFLGFLGRAKPRKSHLLMRKGLLAKFWRRAGERLLNLKDLLTGFPSNWFENDSGLGPLFCAKSRQILTFSGENVRIMAERERLSLPILPKDRKVVLSTLDCPYLVSPPAFPVQSSQGLVEIHQSTPGWLLRSSALGTYLPHSSIWN